MRQERNVACLQSQKAFSNIFLELRRIKIPRRMHPGITVAYFSDYIQAKYCRVRRKAYESLFRTQPSSFGPSEVKSCSLYLFLPLLSMFFPSKIYPSRLAPKGLDVRV